MAFSYELHFILSKLTYLLDLFFQVILGSGSPETLQVRVALPLVGKVLLSNSSTMGLRITTKVTEASILPALFSARHLKIPASSFNIVSAVIVPDVWFRCQPEIL